MPPTHDDLRYLEALQAQPGARPFDLRALARRRGRATGRSRDRPHFNQLICARAELTPPALYRYFDGKYAVLEALGRRLIARQNIVLEQWVERHVEHGVDASRDGIEELQSEAAAVTQSEPGAVWILRALHATPLLVHVRLESHRYVTDQLVAAYARHLPHVDRADLWQRLRLAEDVGFAVDEMLQEEDHIAPERAFKHVAALLRMDLSY